MLSSLFRLGTKRNSAGSHAPEQDLVQTPRSAELLAHQFSPQDFAQRGDGQLRPELDRHGHLVFSRVFAAENYSALFFLQLQGPR
jgi:hypothetical protein